MMDKRKAKAAVVVPTPAAVAPGDDIVMVQGRVSRGTHKRLKKWLVDHDEITQEAAIGMAIQQFMDRVDPKG